ncbi:hypothetical protein [Methylobacterium sp. CM6246]
MTGLVTGGAGSIGGRMVWDLLDTGRTRIVPRDDRATGLDQSLARTGKSSPRTGA